MPTGKELFDTFKAAIKDIPGKGGKQELTILKELSSTISEQFTVDSATDTIVHNGGSSFEQLDTSWKEEAKNVVNELYRDKVLTEYQFNLIIAAIGE